MTDDHSMKPTTLLAHDWAVRCFGHEHVQDLALRALRLAEEAVECAQAAGVSRAMMLKQVDSVYSRPVGNVEQEVGGVMMTVTVLAATLGKDPDYYFLGELRRVMDKPTEHFAKRNEDKLGMGLTGGTGGLFKHERDAAAAKIEELKMPVKYAARSAMLEIWQKWYEYYNQHFRSPGIAISTADQMAFYEIAQPILFALANTCTEKPAEPLTVLPVNASAMDVAKAINSELVYRGMTDGAPMTASLLHDLTETTARYVESYAKQLRAHTS